MTKKEREAINARQRFLRNQNGNAYTKKYEKTKPGFLMRLYRNMESRVTGIQKRHFHLYNGKELLPRNEFYAWANNNPMFHKLFSKWEKSNYDRRLTPSVDRIDPSKGYQLDNMEFITHSENSRRGANSPINKKRVIQMDMTGIELKVWDSLTDAAESLGDKRGAANLSKVCNGKAKRAYGFRWAYA